MTRKLLEIYSLPENFKKRLQKSKFCYLLKFLFEYYNALDKAVSGGDSIDNISIDWINYVFNCQQNHFVLLRFTAILFNFDLHSHDFVLGSKKNFRKKLTPSLDHSSGLDRTEKELSTFLKVESEHRQVVSSKFSKSFMGADDLVVLGV